MVVRALAFVITRRVPGLVGLGPAPDARNIEIAVLRHRLMMVRRQVARPRYAPQDRMVLAALVSKRPQQVRSRHERRRCGVIDGGCVSAA